MAYRRTEYRMLKTIDVEKIHNGRYGAPGCKRLKKKKATPEMIKKQNLWNVIKRLTRKINANFKTDDLHTVLTYRKEERLSPEESKKELSRFLRNMKYQYEKVGKEFKYIVTTEYRNTAIHHHLIINNEHEVKTMSLVRKYWKRGRPKFVPLDDKGDYKKLAEYFVKETEETFRDKDSPHRTRYSCSRNLITPQPDTEIISAKTFSKEPKPYKGYYIDKNSIREGINQVTGYPYQYYTMIKIEKRRE